MDQAKGKPERSAPAERVTERRSNPDQVRRSIESLRAATPEKTRPIDGSMIDDVAALMRGGQSAPEAKPPADDEDQGTRGNDGSTRGSEAQGAQGAEGARDGADGGETSGDADGRRLAPASWDELAERAGATKDELYAVAIPLGNGKTITLGELKDRAREYVDIDTARVELEERRERDQMESIDNRRRIAGIMNRLAPIAAHLPADLMASVETDYKQHLQREATLLRQAAPEWAEPKAAEAGREMIAAFLKPYGFSSAEVAAMDDHRFVLAAHDAAKAKAALKAAREAIKRRVSEGDGLPNKGREGAAGVPPKSNAASPGRRAQAQQTDRLNRITRLIAKG
jgi:hypothetical protein